MYLVSNGQKVYYEEAGSGNRILLLHGWGVSSETFRPLLLSLSKNAHLRAIDFSGFGQSEPPPEHWGVPEYAEQLLDIISQWGWGGCTIIAHSFGGRVAIRATIKQPEAFGKLLLTGSAGIRRKSRISLRKQIISKAGKFAGLFGSAGLWLKGKLYATIGSADYLSAGSMRQVFVRVVNDDLTELLPSVANQTLLLWGVDDDATPIEDGEMMQRFIKNSRLVKIHGAGHYAFLDKPQQFKDELLRFLES